MKIFHNKKGHPPTLERNSFTGTRRSISDDDRTMGRLTNRETEVLALLAQSLTNREIANSMVLAPSTVRWYLSQIYSKLDVHNRREAVSVAEQRGLLKRNIIAYQPALVSHHQARSNPYQGFKPFSQSDAGFFFGREMLVQRLLTRLKECHHAPRLLALVGPHGIGKTSVIRAGLMLALEQGGLKDSEHWHVAEMVPSPHMLDEMEIALTRTFEPGQVDIIAQLNRDERGLIRVARMLLPRDGRLLLIIDHFEELFSYGSTNAQLDNVLNLLSEAVSQPCGQVIVLIAMCVDSFERVLRHTCFGPLLCNNVELVGPMTPKELRTAIINPALQVGVVVESALVEKLEWEMNRMPCALPFLQLLLMELYLRRKGKVMTLASYQQMSGLTGTLIAYAEGVCNSADNKDRALLRNLITWLIKQWENSNVYCRSSG
jgi:DNA-binding CsgD family transcriptional regulator